MSISLKNLNESNAEAINASAAIRAARQAIGYSIEDLAVTCGLLVLEIQQVENGEDADPTKLKRIAAALQMPLTAFIPERL